MKIKCNLKKENTMRTNEKLLFTKPKSLSYQLNELIMSNKYSFISILNY